jgi:hypothetical protein
MAARLDVLDSRDFQKQIDAGRAEFGDVRDDAPRNGNRRRRNDDR